MLETESQELNVAVAVAELILKEAETCRMEYLKGVATRKLVIIPVKDLHVLLEAGWEILEQRGIIRT